MRAVRSSSETLNPITCVHRGQKTSLFASHNVYRPATRSEPPRVDTRVHRTGRLCACFAVGFGNVRKTSAIAFIVARELLRRDRRWRCPRSDDVIRARISGLYTQAIKSQEDAASVLSYTRSFDLVKYRLLHN